MSRLRAFGTCLGTMTLLVAIAACGTPGAMSAAVASHAYTAPATSPPAPSASATHARLKPSASAKATRPKPAQSAAVHSGSAPAPTTKPNGNQVAPPPAGSVAAGSVAVGNADHVVGNGKPASCTSAAVVAAVAAGGVIAFDCGPDPVTITMTATAEVANTSHQVVLDGGGKVTLSGGGKVRILFMNPGWQQQWPELVVQNLTFADAYSGTQQSSTSTYGGGAIFAQGGQLKVINSVFTGNKCYESGPDLGGGAIRSVGMYPQQPVDITGDTFTGNSCSNGGALSGLYAEFNVTGSQFTGNSAIGWGANPAAAGTAGGGSGGAIYTDGNAYDLSITNTKMSGNTAREGGGAIFFVVNSGGGTLTIDNSTLTQNPSGQFQNAPGIFSSVNGATTPPTQTASTIS